MADELFPKVRTTVVYRMLDRTAFDRTLQFLEHGGSALASYSSTNASHGTQRDATGSRTTVSGGCFRRA